MTIIERSGVERKALPDADSPSAVADTLADLERLTRIVRPVLDEPYCRFDLDPPVWSMPPKKIGPLTLRTATVITVSRDGDVVVVDGARADQGDVPMTMQVRMTPEATDRGLVLVSDWEMQLETFLPGPLVRIAKRVIDQTIAETTETLLGTIADEFSAG